MAGARLSGLVALALLLDAGVLCSGGPGGLADRRRSLAVEAEPFAVNLDLYEEDEEEDADIDFFQLGDDPMGAINAAMSGAGGRTPVSIWPMEEADADAGYSKDAFGRRRYDPATTTFEPEEAENVSTPCVVNGSSSPEVIEVKVPVPVLGNGTQTERVKTVIETKYIPVNIPGETKYVPMPGVPYGIPVPGVPSSTGCPPCNGAPPVNLAPASWPVGCPPPTAPCVSSSSAVARVAAAAADLAHHNLQQALANGVMPSPLAQDAHAIAQQAAAKAAAAEDSAAIAKAKVQGVMQRVRRLRNRLYHAATARAAELNKVRVVPPTFPVSIIPPGPPQSAYGAYGWAPAPAPAAFGYVR